MTIGPSIQVILEAIDRSLLSTLDKLSIKFVGIEAAARLLGQGLRKVNDALQKMYDFLADASEYAGVQERSLRQLSSALAVTGKEAEVTAEEVAKFAAELQKTTKFGDELSIEASKWFAQMPNLDPSMMEDYLSTAQDMAEVMGVDLRIAAQVLARALEDPRRASRALRRANIMLSTEQRKMLETFDDVNDMAAAQSVIMDGVADSVGGAAKDMASTLEGVRGQIKGILADMMEHIGAYVNDAILPATRIMKESLENWSSYFGAVRTGVEEGTKAIDEWIKSLDVVTDEDRLRALEAYTRELSDLEKAGWGVASMLESLSKEMLDRQMSGDQGGGTLDAFLPPGALEVMRQAYGLLVDMGEEKAAQAALDRAEQERSAGMLRLIMNEQREMNRQYNESKAESYREEMERLKEIERERAKFLREARSWIERTRRASLTADEKAAEDLKRLNDLREEGLVTEEERLQIIKKISEEWEKSYELEKKAKAESKLGARASEDMGRIAEQMNRINAQIAKAEGPQDFKAAISSLQGHYDRMATAAASTAVEDKTVEELKFQRELLKVQYAAAQKAREDSLKRLESIDTFAAEIAEKIEYAGRFTP